MLTTAQRERIVSHLRRGWKLPDSLLLELWEAYEALEQAHTRANSHLNADATRPQPERGEATEQRRP
jgi:hypothetical protein